jgi:hypothetical protein
MYSAIEDIIIDFIHEWYHCPEFECDVRIFQTQLSNKCGFNILDTRMSWIDNKGYIMVKLDTLNKPTKFTVCVDSDNFLDIGEFSII